MRNASVQISPAPLSEMPYARRLELVCTALDLPSMHEAIRGGADCVQLHCINASNSGPEGYFMGAILQEMEYARENDCKVMWAIHEQSTSSNWAYLCEMIDQAAFSRADGIVLCDPALALFAAAHHPWLL